MNAVYQLTLNPMMWGMARMSRKLKSFRLAPNVAAVVERAAADLNKSEGEIIDYCVAKSILSVVEEQSEAMSSMMDAANFKAFTNALDAWRKLQAEKDTLPARVGGRRSSSTGSAALAVVKAVAKHKRARGDREQ